MFCFQRNWNRGINSDLALRGVGKGPPPPVTVNVRGGSGRGTCGPGGLADRGRGRGRGGFSGYTRGISYEETPDLANSMSSSSFSRSTRPFDRTQVSAYHR